jgi:hypothetical protein
MAYHVPERGAAPTGWIKAAVMLMSAHYYVMTHITTYLCGNQPYLRRN